MASGAYLEREEPARQSWEHAFVQFRMRWNGDADTAECTDIRGWLHGAVDSLRNR